MYDKIYETVVPIFTNIFNPQSFSSKIGTSYFFLNIIMFIKVDIKKTGV